MFEHLKEAIKDYRKRRGISSGSLTEHAITTGISAGSAGSVAAVLTTPVDVVKTRIMLSAAGGDSDADAKEEVKRAQAKGKSAEILAKEKGVSRKSGLTVAREVFKDGGIKALFRGGLLRGGWTAIGSGLYLSTYEASRLYLERGRATEESSV
jgi:solute carrier family 25 S-adenosylmethionine transporter 26